MKEMGLNNVVSFSGGKDSTAMLLMMLERGEPIHSVVFFDTGWEFSEMHDHLAQVEKYTGIEIVKLKPRKPFSYWMFEREVRSRATRRDRIGISPRPDRKDFENDEEWEFEFEAWELDPYEYQVTEKGDVYRIGNGWPSATRRWCTREKVTEIERYLAKIDNPISCIGLAHDEQHRVKKQGKFPNRYPLIEMGIDEPGALSYCYKHGFNWNGLYNVFSRVSCFCCPLQGIEQLRLLRRYYPKLWNTMLEWDKMAPEHNRGFKDYRSVHDLEARFAEDDRQLVLPGIAV